MNPSINRIRASDGSGDAALATIQSSRAPLASTIDVDTVAGIPDEFFGSMGTPHTFTDPITSETITVISEATAVNFAGHVDGANLEIDEISPGYTDGGSEVGDIVIIRPVTAYADNIADVLEESHDDDGTLKESAVLASLATARGVLGDVHYYTADDTWSKPAGLKFVVVQTRGGGGGGGGVGTSAGTGAASGGGEGEYAEAKILAAALASTVAVDVGAGGAGGVGENASADNSGATSSFGAHLTAFGGGKPQGSTGANNSRVGGKGGTGGGGSATNAIHVPGAPGGQAPTGGGGTGGGAGGALGANGVGNGAAATANGGGGGAGGFDTGTTSRNGGAGGNGYIIVREYY